MKQQLETNTTMEIRLERIEDKLDQLTSAMVQLARAEEKIGNLQDNHNNQVERMNRLSVKIDEIERIVLDNHRTVGVLNKLFWVAISVVIAGIFSNVYMAGM